MSSGGCSPPSSATTASTPAASPSSRCAPTGSASSCSTATPAPTCSSPPTSSTSSSSRGIADAENNLGESEVREAHLAKSLYFIRVSEKEKALEQLKVTEGKTVAIGQKMDLVSTLCRLAFSTWTSIYSQDPLARQRAYLRKEVTGRERTD